MKKMWIESLLGIWEMAWASGVVSVPGSPSPVPQPPHCARICCSEPTLGSPTRRQPRAVGETGPSWVFCTLTHLLDAATSQTRDLGADGSWRAALVIETPQRPTSSTPEGPRVTCRRQSYAGAKFFPKEFLFLLAWGLTWDLTALSEDVGAQIVPERKGTGDLKVL